MGKSSSVGSSSLLIVDAAVLSCYAFAKTPCRVSLDFYFFKETAQNAFTHPKADLNHLLRCLM